MEDRIRALLDQITLPGTDRALGSCLKDVELEDGELTVVLDLTGVDRALRHQLEDQALERLKGIEDLREVFVEIEVSDLPQYETRQEAGLSVHGGGKPAAPAKKALADVKHLIAVASGKGGVGKSTVAVNLALALKARGARIGIVDLDIYGPSVPVLLGVAGAKPGVSSDQKRFTPVEAYGVKVMSIGFLVDDDTPVIWRGPIVASVVKQFLDDVEWGALDYLIIDMPPGTGDAQLTLTQSAPITGALIVTTPSELALLDAVKGLQMFRKVDTPVLGLVENMSHFICPECGHHADIFNAGGTARVSEKFGAEVIARVPIDTEIQRGGDHGKPVTAVLPDSSQAQAFLGLADQVIGKLPFAEAPVAEKKGFLANLFKR